ncbi:Multidrug resistance protein 1 [Apophysomyces ossiformis]|uniref:Multidrug resistance protein 1 n=1 Tax=Apophysomyces ossiformis TaxID=679940 RepID=A0A8H7BY57_9FUNG|nr:Multidrug resistance protein 1 [Apophysomyces ossiformis]
MVSNASKENKTQSHRSQASLEEEKESVEDIDTEDIKVLQTFEVSVKEKVEDQTSNDQKVKKKKKKKEPSLAIYQLFRFASKLDILMVTVAIVLSACIGALQPVSIIIYGQILKSLSVSLSDTDGLLAMTTPAILSFVYMGTAVTVAGYLANFAWIYTGANQARRIRTLYVHAIMRQDMAWYDKSEEGSLATRLAADTQIVQDGISEKFGLMVLSIGQFAAGFIVAFIKGWRLAVVMLAAVPVLGISGTVMDHFATKYTVNAQNAYADAGSVAEQVFAGIRTVYAFSLQKRFSKRYDMELDKAMKAGFRRGIISGIGFGVFLFTVLATYGLAFWYGYRLVLQGQLDGPTVVVVFFAMITGASALLELPPNLLAVSSACGAAYKVFSVIDRVPDIDPYSKEGVVPQKMEGEIEFRNVQFKYPTRPDVVVLKNLTLKIRPGMTVAFVGPSGSGKSTTIQLLQRFYDPIDGQVLLDGHDLKSLNVHWLRQQIGVVSQEPVLFNMTIRQNLLMGISHDVSEEEMIEACKKANCHKFISQLPQKYDTIVGEHGGMLSGGQKQRVAIARAIIKNPPILLLDEATSALDTQSERLVQKALDAAAESRTSIVVAHRLSTIRNADLIVVMEQGVVVEQGKHNELLEKGGVYAQLVARQEIATDRSEGSVSTSNDHDHDDEEEIDIGEEPSETLKASKALANEEDSVVATERHSVISIDAYERKLGKQKEEKKLKKKQSAPVFRVLMQMRPEWPLLFVGILGAGLAGAVFPSFSLIFGSVVASISTPSTNAQGPLEGPNLYAFVFVMLGVAALVGFSIQVTSFEIAGERYTKRLRSQLFQAYMRQEVGYYDEEDHSLGSLVSKLAVDAKNVNDMITKVWGDLSQVIVKGIAGMIIAFVHSWLLTLVLMCLTPFIMFATAYRAKIESGCADQTKKANEQTSEVIGEAIKEIRTVTALNKQLYFENRYHKATERPHRIAHKKAVLSSIGFGMDQGIIMYAYALGFYVGVRLVMDHRIDFQQLMVTLVAIMIAAQGMGRSSVFISSFAKAKLAAIATFEVIDRQSKIDPDVEGIEPPSSAIRGDISFKDIAFRYPARPDMQIFKGEFNLEGKAGQTIALVGPSGCGKSTAIGMLQRWYEPEAGSVRLDDHPIDSFSLWNLRSHMALVGQEPVLFDLSIADNIRFGVSESENISDADVEEACKAANIHKFISNLPNGYDTRVGDKGSQLSGGQKQRIAIARALIRKPRVLLLDEATSALDSESEKIVQAAIDNILQEGGRTTITIAHRLSTVQNSDLICVIKDGYVIEQGTHWELLKLQGVYSELVHQQSLNAD